MYPRSAAAAALAFALCPAMPAMADAAAEAAEAREKEREDESVDAVRTPAVEVTAARGTAADSPDALAVDVVRYEEAIAAPADFQDLITRIPGVGATGQNGIFETFSIRGSGANEVQILYASMPLTAQRRAGVPVSFVEPILLGDIAVTRGPAVVHYGPGALGGAVSVEPRWFDSAVLAGNYASGGDESLVAGGIGGESFSIGAACHQSDDTEAPEGTPLHTQFERASAVLQYRREFGDFAFDAMLSPSRTEDIGKSNSRFPARDTIYPHDDHTVGRVRLRHSNGFQASVQGHEQDLRTVNRRPGFATTFADVESRDIGATVQQTFATGDWRHDIGFEYLGRRNVDAFDATGTISNRKYTLRDANEDGWSLFAISDWEVSDRFSMEFGARHSGIDQENKGADLDDSDTGFTAGAVWRPNDAHRLSLNLARGYRFASLEERFFSGVTAQGEVVGNPDLSSERSLGIDLGHAWSAGNWRTEVHLWHNDVDDLIQLTAVAPGVNGFENIADAKLWGAEAAIGWTPVDGLALRAGWAVVNSEDERTDDPLFGSPPVTTELEAKWRFADAWTIGARYMHRSDMDDPGFEEVERDSVDVLDAELSWRVSPSWTLKLYAQNLFDEEYFATADALSALAPERSIGVSVVWGSLD
jgi:iron complex outermembrane receptor protein